MELYMKIVKSCERYGCLFVHTVGHDCLIKSRCGHNSTVSTNEFQKHKLGIYCNDCLGDIFVKEVATCLTCSVQFVPTQTKFLFCSKSCGSRFQMTDERKQDQRKKMLKRTLDYLNDDGSLKSDEEIDNVMRAKRKKQTLITKTFGDSSISFQKVGIFVEYSVIKNAYESKGCILHTTEQEYLTMKEKMNLKSMWFSITSICGHREKSLYYSFLADNTCLYCKKCTLIRARERLIGQGKTEDGYGTSLMTQKLAVDIVKKKCEDMFDCVKTRDGCDSDLLIRPNGNRDDLWLKVKVKSTTFGEGNLCFRINKIYQAIYLLVSIVTEEIWMFDQSELVIRTYYMKQHKNIYDEQLIKSNQDLCQKLAMEHSKNVYTGTFDMLNNPISPTMQLEYKYVLRREQTITYLKFDRNEISGAVYNFRVGKLKFQESVCSKQAGKNIFTANISKNCGQKGRKSYNIGDNDFYWININEKLEHSDEFFVVPESALLENGFIDDPSGKKGHKYLTISANPWIYKYRFHWSTVANEPEKNRLLTLLGIEQ